MMLIDRDVRFSLLSTMEILKNKNEWLTVKDIIECLKMRMNRFYDRRSVYDHIRNLELFGYVETKICKNNTKYVRWLNSNCDTRKKQNDSDHATI